MKIKRKIIEIDEEKCDGCGNCVTSCEEGAIQIIDGKAKVINDVFCDGLGACIGDCPLDALKIVEREAAAFDEEAVKVHLENLKEEQPPAPKAAGCGCPSSRLQSFTAPDPGLETACAAANKPVTHESSQSELSQWPIQINLIPPTAPFLKNADLLIAADCVPAASPDFHQQFLKDKVLMLGCPKLDNAEAYVEKFAAIFQTADVRSITIVIMEVPCCSGMPMIIRRALDLSGRQIPVEEVVISIREGKVIQRLRN